MNFSSIKTRAYILLGTVAGVSIIASITIIYSLIAAADDADIVNALGRQRMLTQAMGKSVLGYAMSKSEYAEHRVQANTVNTYITKMRGLYSSRIIPNAQKGRLKISMHPENERGAAIPFPATFTRMVNEQFSDGSDIEVDVITKSPINPKQNLKTDKDEKAYEFLLKNPDGIFEETLEDEGGIHLLFYLADKAVNQSCVDCHTAMQNKRFKLGDVLGIRKYEMHFSDNLELAMKSLNPKLNEYETAREVFDKTIRAMQAGGDYPTDLSLKNFKTISKINDKESQVKIKEIIAKFDQFQRTVDTLLNTEIGTDEFREAQNGVLVQSNQLRKVSNDLVTLYTNIANRNNTAILVTVIIAGLITVIALLVLAAYLAMGLFKPMKGVTDMLQDVAEGEGDLTERLEIKSKNEIGDLCHWFNVFIGNIHTMVKDIEENASTIASSTEELSSSTIQMSKTAEEIASGLDKETSALNETRDTIQVMVEDNKANTEQIQIIQQMATNAEADAEKGNEAVLKANQSMNLIEESSKRIEGIINVITEIANQTNLLSLNAAIEAAKAGEFGKGFAVVADEVRSLAERSSNAVVEIQKLIGTSVSNVEDGNIVIHETGEILKHIIDQVREISEKITDVSGKLVEQNNTILSIANASDEISNVSENNSSGANELSATTQQISLTTNELSDIADKLNQQVNKFKI